MNLYRNMFPKPRTMLAVIHAISEEQVLRNAKIAEEARADGIFLINHQNPACDLIIWYAHARRECPSLWIGLNCLDLDVKDTLTRTPMTVGGLWRDDGGIDDAALDPVAKAREFAELRNRYGTHGIYFGGVAFKHQKKPDDPGKAAHLAMPYIDVITTSGPATGYPPSVEKIACMKRAIGKHPLAIASGMTPENVRDFCEYADCFLVATGISKSDTELDADKIAAFVRAISA